MTERPRCPSSKPWFTRVWYFLFPPYAYIRCGKCGKALYKKGRRHPEWDRHPEEHCTLRPATPENPPLYAPLLRCDPGVPGVLVILILLVVLATGVAWIIRVPH